VREYLLVLAVAAAVTYLCTGFTRRFALRFGAITPLRDRDVHVIPMPRLGGLAIMLGVGTAILVAQHLPFLSRIPEVGHDATALLAGASVMFVVGAVDDFHELDGVTKLAGQVVAAGVIVVMGVKFYWLPTPGGIFSMPPVLGAVLSAIVIIATANAVNFVDGLDGLAAGVCVIGALAFFSYAYLLAFDNGLNRAAPPSLIAVAVAGSCLGFLPYNFHPCKLFMGDSGALPLGTLLGGAAVNLTGFLDPGTAAVSGGNATWLPVLLPLILTVAVLALPGIDLVLAVIRRTKEGRSPFSSDRGHLHHRMLDMGHSHRGSVLLLWAWAAVIGFGIVLIVLRGGVVMISAVSLAVVGLLLGTLVTPTRLRRRRRHRDRRESLPRVG
jgi:UDP-GlcNAc:undecaprenyl-phosphate/decaprenyl-phosphate GlcNAc-1-phosphate transferase